MRILDAVRNHPVVLFAAVIVAFAAWVGLDTTSRSDAAPLGPPEPLTLQAAVPLPPMPDLPAQTTVVTAAMVNRLHPGMTRTDVEGLIGPPPGVDPVSNVDGRLTYRATYPAALGAPQPPTSATSAANPQRSVIGLEFDATQPGHPLVRVHIPDPRS
jgi:hypothetical protein